LILNTQFTHAAIARRYKFIILVTLTLVLMENVFIILRPYFLGLAIDSLLENNLGGLFLFLTVAFAGLSLAVGRRYYDTRAYGKIYKTIGAEVIDQERSREASTAQITARANFVREFCNFHLDEALYCSLAMYSNYRSDFLF